MYLTKLFRRGMSCSDALEILQSYLDGETDDETAREVAAHLGRCDHCERESVVYRRIKVSLTRHRRDVDPEVMSALSRFGRRLAEGD